MTQLVLFARLVKWDFLRELRRKEAVLNMILFAVLVLFVISMGAGPLIDEWRRAGRLLEREGLPESLFVDLGSAVGPVLLWATVLFAGTVGLSQSFAAEREGEGLVAIVLAPLDLGVFYLAKVFATWVYVILMEVFLLGAYAVLFTVPGWREVGLLLIVLVVFSLGYMAAGVVLAAMTSALRRGGEVVLRILLFPLLMPLIYLTLRVEEALLGFATPMGVPIPLPSYVAMALAFDVIYLTAGFVIFPKVLEE